MCDSKRCILECCRPPDRGYQASQVSLSLPHPRLSQVRLSSPTAAAAFHLLLARLQLSAALLLAFGVAAAQFVSHHILLRWKYSLVLCLQLVVLAALTSSFTGPNFAYKKYGKVTKKPDLPGPDSKYSFHISLKQVVRSVHSHPPPPVLHHCTGTILPQSSNQFPFIFSKNALQKMLCHPV